jgi:hypothetical protein
VEYRKVKEIRAWGRRKQKGHRRFVLAFEWDVFSEIGSCNIRILEAAGIVGTARNKVAIDKELNYSLDMI